MSKLSVVIFVYYFAFWGVAHSQDTVCFGENCEIISEYDHDDIVNIYTQLGALDFQILNNSLVSLGIMNPTVKQCMIDCNTEFVSNLALCKSSMVKPESEGFDPAINDEALQICADTMRQKQTECMGKRLECMGWPHSE